MSAPSMLLLSAGAASSLAAVWQLAGFSESSAVRFKPRVLVAAAAGLSGELAVYVRAPFNVRSELALSMLFALASVAALVVGAAKIEGALERRDGACVIRRSSGLVSGTCFGLGAIGAGALELGSLSREHAGFGWALMFGLLASTFVAFGWRARYAGVGSLRLGPRLVGLLLLLVALLVGARLRAGKTSAPPSAEAAPSAVATPLAPAPLDSAGTAPSGSAAPAEPPSAASPAEPPSAVPSIAASVVAPAATPGLLSIESVTARGLLEADVRGGVSRRIERLNACLQGPETRRAGVLSLKIGIDASGSVTYSKAVGGDLVGTPLAKCLLANFYKMGFAAPAVENASFEITLRSSAE
jgi:hypothetical protein